MLRHAKDVKCKCGCYVWNGFFCYACGELGWWAHNCDCGAFMGKNVGFCLKCFKLNPKASLIDVEYSIIKYVATQVKRLELKEMLKGSNLLIQ